MQYLVQMFTPFQRLEHILPSFLVLKTHAWGKANWIMASEEIKDAFSSSINTLFFKN